MKSLKLLLMAALLLCTSSSRINAQTPDTSTTQGLIRYIFQNINKTQIPTGFLEEYGAPMVPMATFNGSLTDSNRIDMNLWRTLYFQLQTGYAGSSTNPLPSITAVNSVIKQNTNDTLPVPIPLLISQYNTVKANAFSSNLLSYNTSTRQIFDVAGRSQSPYQTSNLFAACPNKEVSLKGTERFIFKSNLIWNTTGKSISQIQVDFGNSLGLTNVTMVHR